MNLRLSGIRKRRGDFVLDVPRLELTPGERVALCGPNGAGKTTLLEIMAGLLPADAGEIRLDALPAGHSLRALRRRVTLLFQEPVLFRGSVLTNVMFGLRVRGLSRRESRQKALSVLGRVEMEEFAERKARELSAGEAQRVAIARALALDVDCILFDEPLANLDLRSVRIFERILGELAETGKMVAMAVHQIGWVYDHCERMLTLVGGRVYPTSPENIFRGELRADGKLLLDGIEVGTLAGEPGVVQVMIDPQKVRVSRVPEPGALQGTVISASRAGALTRLRVDVGIIVVALVAPNCAPLPGESVFLRVKCERLPAP